MKTTKILNLAVSFAIVSFASQKTFAKEGNDGGNGGNTLASEFADVAKDAFDSALRVNRLINVDNAQIDLKTIAGGLAGLKIRVSPAPLSLRGASVDAINYPQAREIHFYKDSWISKSLSEKRRLAVHEALGIAGYPDQDYRISRKIVSSITGIYELTKSKFADITVEETRMNPGDERIKTLCPQDTNVVNGTITHTRLDVTATDRSLYFSDCDSMKVYDATKAFERLSASPYNQQCMKSANCNGNQCNYIYGVQSVAVRLQLMLDHGNRIMKINELKDLGTCK